MGWQGYNAVLSSYVDEDGQVDYAGLQASRASLDTVVDVLAEFPTTDYDALSPNEQKAFWANAYNALTLKVIIDHYPIRARWPTKKLHPHNSIRQIPGAWKKIQHTVMGRQLTLDGIEHDVLRKDWSDPGIHFAIVCASISCPPLRNEAYRGTNWEEQIGDQVKTFLSHTGNFQIDREAGQLKLNPILNWFMGDFSAYSKPLAAKLNAPLRGVVHYIIPHVDEDTAEWLRTASYQIAWQDYDWSLNEQQR